MKNCRLILMILSIFSWITLFAQQGAAINTTGAAPAASAMLDVSATNKGILVPRMTTTQRTAIIAPANGLLVYDNTTNSFWYYNNTAWQNLATSSSTFANQIKDADGNTKITVEKNPNEDIIRLDLAGTERMKLIQNASGDPRLELLGTIENTLFVGSGAGANNTAVGNTFLGTATGNNTTTGENNTFVGALTGQLNTSGKYNTFVGLAAGQSNTTGTDNIFIGAKSGGLTTTGNGNAFLGTWSGYWNTEGIGNTFIGHYTGYKNTIANYNTFLGFAAGEKNTTGTDNTFIGMRAGDANNSGAQNTFIGRSAGENNLTGNSNVFLGYSSGFNETGSNRLYIENSDMPATQALIYGEFDNDRVQINNKLGIGRLPTTNALEVNGNFASKTLAGSWAANCDARLKRNIQPLNPEESLAKILSMRGVSFEWNDTKTAYKRPTGQQIGFIAQDVQKVFPQNVQTDTEGYLQTAYAEYDPIFVEAFRALNAKNEALKLENQKIQEALQAAKTLIERMAVQQQAFENRLLELEKAKKQ